MFSVLSSVRRIGLALCSALFINPALPSNNIHYSQLSSQIGEKPVTSIHKDEYGHLWIGTQRGLHFFNGGTPTIFSAGNPDKHGVPVSDIRGIFQDPSGKVVLATYGGGLAISNNLQNHFSKVENHRADQTDYFTKAYRGPNGDMWLSTKSTIFRSSGQSLELENIAKIFPELKDHTGPWVISSQPKNDLVLGTGSDLFYYSATNNRLRTLDFDVSLGGITAIIAWDNGSLIGTDSGKVVRFSTTENRVVHSFPLDPDGHTNIVEIVEYDDGIWIATDRGLYVLDKDMTIQEVIDSSNSALPSNHITILYKFSEDLLIGTYAGLVHASPTRFEHFDQANSDVYNDVMCLEEDQDGQLWVGTFDGIYLFNNESGTHERFLENGKTKLPDQRVMSIEATKSSIWLGLWKSGVAKIDKATGEVTIPFPELAQSSVTKILSAKDNDIWISTLDAGIFRIRDSQLVTFPELDNRAVTDIAALQSGDIAAITEQSIYRFSYLSQKLAHYPIIFPEHLKETIPLSITEDQQGGLLLGSKDRGVFILSSSKDDLRSYIANQYSKDPGLASISVYALALDESNSIWLSTDNGILNLESNGELRSRFGTGDGLQGNDFNFGAHVTRSDGRMVFGGPNGYNQFLPASIKRKKSAPKVSIPSIRMGNGKTLNHIEINDLDELIIGPISYALNITLGVDDYLNTSYIRFSHRLQGLEEDWIESSGQDTITYTNLDPGTYIFQAKGANASGIWSDNEVSLKIVVLPPWWATWWAYATYLVLSVLFVWSGLRLYRNHLLKEEAIRIAAEMHDAADKAHDDLQESQEYQDELVRAVSQHNLDTLSLISKCLSKVDGDEQSSKRVQGYLKAIELLEMSYFFQENELVADLHTYVDRLANHLLPMASIDPATITTINHVSGETIPAKSASPLAVIIYELLSNSLMHAFDPESRANFVEIKMAIQRDADGSEYIDFSLSDDGTAHHINCIDEISRTSGNEIVKELVSELGGSHRVSVAKGHSTQLRIPLGPSIQ